MRSALPHIPTAFNKLSALWRGSGGAMAAMAAFMLTAMLGLTGAAVDVGLIASTHNELQNAADAAALAGAGSMLAFTPDGSQISAQTATGLSTAQQVSLANQASGVSLSLRPEDVIIGFWDLESDSFDSSKSGSGDPDDITGFRATLRRDALANGPLGTFFAGMVGYGQVELSATSIAYLGWSGRVDPVTVDLPLAVHASALQEAGSPGCGMELTFNNEASETAEWTSFFTWPTNDVTVRDYVEGAAQTPALQVGDSLNVINGNLSTHTMESLAGRFQAEGSDLDGDGTADSWEVVVPVVNPGSSSTASTVAGFATLVLTEADGAHASFYLQCDRAIVGSTSGGGNYGTRATLPSLIQ
ncbi:MAG: hypothetical protein K9K66_08325 [Desulfarculaceae bacterium]|nr:hypothetical protein [Desulfarculaceae bacterium]MCF8071325.1 hypothetical protein [Desulfarculaceae bacterium]MCF8101650.1 hypothetical protein [Desulfarculaceae bacterium]MCF8116741.1 hypothetical protein [Desulfarculaceae bacterium]